MTFFFHGTYFLDPSFYFQMNHGNQKLATNFLLVLRNQVSSESVYIFQGKSKLNQAFQYLIDRRKLRYQFQICPCMNRNDNKKLIYSGC